MKFRVELWRIIKFILITGAVNLPLTMVYGAIVNGLSATGQPGVGNWLAVITYGQIGLSTVVLTLLHRFFTFRATEKWYIALPVMLIAAAAWQFAQAYILSAGAKISVNTLYAIAAVQPFLWPVLSYLLQRCVIYCHTTDTNGWYRRFHPTNDE